MKKLFFLFLWLLTTQVWGANPLLGGYYNHPWDLRVTHQTNNLRGQLYEYFLSSLDYNIWTNGSGGLPYPTNNNGPAYYDLLHSLSSGLGKEIMAFYNVPTNAISSFVPAIVARYSPWAVQPINEKNNAGVAANTIKLFRLALPTARLIGPAYPNDYAPAYLDQLVASNAIQQLDILAMHDYFAVPGNGSGAGPPWPTNYIHPDTTNWAYAGYPNLIGRINWMKSYVPYLRTNYNDIPKVWITEYGVYVNDPNAACRAAIILREAGVVAFPWGAMVEAGRSNSAAYCHAFYNSNHTAITFSESIRQFLKNFSDGAK